LQLTQTYTVTDNAVKQLRGGCNSIQGNVFITHISALILGGNLIIRLSILCHLGNVANPTTVASLT